jgi:RNA polymerase sigma factor (sigma-70 family)
VVKFEEVFARCNPLLLRIVYYITHSREAAEDIVQECFISYVEHPGPDSSLADAKYWLIRVAKNKALNQVKRKDTYRSVLKKKMEEEEQPKSDPEHQFLRKAALEKVRLAINDLPEKYRIPLQLREYGGLSYKEISMVLQCSESNVKIQIYRARKKLMNTLGEIYVDLS